MRVIDIDQKIIVPIVDETKGGMVYEAQMTVAELFAKFLPDFEPKVVDAISVEWVLGLISDEERYTLKFRHAWSTLVVLWQKKQEAEN